MFISITRTSPKCSIDLPHDAVLLLFSSRSCRCVQHIYELLADIHQAFAEKRALQTKQEVCSTQRRICQANLKIAKEIQQ